MAEQDTPPPTITAMKIPIIKKGEYDIWSMRMRQYICHTDHNLWDVIVNGDLEEKSTPTGETFAPLAPKTAKQLTAKRYQERVKSILLLAIPDEYLLKFHNVADAKSLWAAIKARFGGNEESKKMQKNVLKHQFENFTTASNENLDKAYDRFQKLISQLEVHGAPISKEDINQKFLRSLPPSWNQIALIMRNKPDIDEIDIDDLYNNLRVYEDEMKRSSSSTSTSQYLAFLSSENASSTNEVSTASGDFGVSTTGGISQVSTTLCSHDVASGRNQGRRSYGDNGRSNALTNESLSQALVAQDGLGSYDWSNDFEVEPVNYALMAISSSSSSSTSDDKNELAWGEKYKFQNYELKCREIKINNLNLELEKVVKERDELKLKIEKWEESSKNLDELLNSQMSARDKTGLGYGTQLNEMSNNSKTDSEISLSVFDVRSSDEENTPANDMFSKADGFHAVPPPITGNFLTPRADISFAGLDEYAIRKKIIESKTTDLNTKTSETVGKTNEANTQKPKTLVMFRTNETQTVKTQVDKIGQISQKEGIGFKKIKACFVCKSTDHLIKDCDFYAKKSPEPKLKTVVNTGQRVVKPVWDNAKRVNHQKISNKLKYPQARRTFVPSGVLTRTGLVNPVRPNGKRAVHTVSTARPISTARPVSTARPFAPKIAQTGSAIRPVYPRMDNVRPRASYSPIKRSYYTKPVFRPKNLKQDVKTSRVKNMTTAGTRAVVNTGKGKMDNALKKSRWVWRPKGNYMDHESKEKGSFILKKFEYGNPEICLEDHAVVDSGCSSHMTGSKAYLSDYEDYNGGFVAFGSDPKGGKIRGKGKIRTANLDFDDVYFVDELKFNLFSVSQMCDKKNCVLFTDTECLILSPSFKLLDENQVVLRAPRQNGVYILDLKNIVPSGGITCLYANATTDESKLWHRRLGHVNFKNINKLVKGHLVRGLPSKVFVNDHTCVACKKGLENQLNHKVKIIRSDHGTEFKNHAMNVFGAKKWIKREFSVARTPQQNGVVERKNRTLIEAARTMLADSLLPIPFWAEAVNTACYVLNRVLVTKPQNKTPYELLIGKPPSISFMRPFGCPLTILNTLDPLGKFDGKSDEGYLLGYSTSSKAFRVYNKRTKRVEDSLHIDFLEVQPNVAGNGPDWMFDLDFLTNTMNYIPISIENQVTVDVEDVAEKEEQHNLTEAEQALKDDLEKLRAAQATSINKLNTGSQSFNTANTPYVSAASTPTGANTGESSFVYLGGQIPIDASTLPNVDLPIDLNMPDLEDDSDVFSNEGIFSGAYDDKDKGAEADFNNMDNTIDVSPIPTLRIHKDHPKGQIVGDPKSQFK
ncbi:ribonuclease H-like domain-containing protein [Tanacetum coccineum]